MQNMNIQIKDFITRNEFFSNLLQPKKFNTYTSILKVHPFKSSNHPYAMHDVVNTATYEISYCCANIINYIFLLTLSAMKAFLDIRAFQIMQPTDHCAINL